MKRLFLLLTIALFSVWASAAPALEGGRMKFDFSDSSWTLTHSGVGEVLPSADGVEGTVLQLTGNGQAGKAYRSGNKNPYRRYSASEGEEDSNYTASFKPGTGAHGAAPEKKDNNENTGDKKDD